MWCEASGLYCIGCSVRGFTVRGFRVCALGISAQCLRPRDLDLAFRDQDAGTRAWGLRLGIDNRGEELWVYQCAHAY